MLCGGQAFDVVAGKLRHEIPRKVVRCRGCELVSLDQPSDAALDYAQDEYRRRHGPVLGKESTPAEMFEVSLPLQQPRVERVRHLLNSGAAVVEVGCSTGHFLHSVRPRVGRAAGIEPNPKHAAFARDQLGLEVASATLEEARLDAAQFDVAFMFQVLEHVADPLAFLGRCSRLLKPEGTIYLEVPNIDDALLSVYGVPEYRNFYFRAPHVYYYSAATLQRLMERAGFSGRISCAQTYTLFNHVHWLHSGRPQASQAEGYGLPRWAPSPEREEASAAIRGWMTEADRGYRDLLARTGIGEILCFEGRRRPE